MTTLSDYVWVFVGCGGTFYAASPYLAVLRKRYLGQPTILFDPDNIEAENHSRQWPGSMPGEIKVVHAARVLPLGVHYALAERFDPNNESLDAMTDGRPVLAIVNVDNDATRLAVTDWIASRVSPGIVVVSGCERDYGQVYAGVWQGGEAIHDWRDHHPDVGGASGPVNPCNLQNIRANALTGPLVGMCIEELAQHVEIESWASIQEFYWTIDSMGKLSVYSTVAVCGIGEETSDAL